MEWTTFCCQIPEDQFLRNRLWYIWNTSFNKFRNEFCDYGIVDVFFHPLSSLCRSAICVLHQANVFALFYIFCCTLLIVGCLFSAPCTRMHIWTHTNERLLFLLYMALFESLDPICLWDNKSITVYSITKGFVPLYTIFLFPKVTQIDKVSFEANTGKYYISVKDINSD